MANQNVMVVEDEFIIAYGVVDMLEEMGHSVCGISDTADMAVEMAASRKPSLILMDVRLKGKKDGIDAALEIFKTSPCPVIYITGSQEPATVERINDDHPAAILFKPVMFERLKSTIENVFRSRP